MPVVDAEARIPVVPGLYGWWARLQALPGITGPAHPTVGGLELLYVGIASDLRARMVNKHVRGGTGASTLRRSLAALLLDREGLRTRWTTTRVVLIPEDDKRLTAWIREHLYVTWCEGPDPASIEPAVIAALAPPLNLGHNVDHPAYGTVKAARSAWRASAGPRP